MCSTRVQEVTTVLYLGINVLLDFLSVTTGSPLIQQSRAVTSDRMVVTGARDDHGFRHF